MWRKELHKGSQKPADWLLDELAAGWASSLLVAFSEADEIVFRLV